MKCIACDCFLTDTELMMVKEDNSFEDMCYDCRGISFNAENIDVREYQHQHLTEMAEKFLYMRKSKENIDIA